MRLGLGVFGNFNDRRSLYGVGFFLGVCLTGVRMLIEFVDVELVNPIVAAVSFRNGLSVLLEHVNLVKVGIHNIFI
jgi:hypothetical protein